MGIIGEAQAALEQVDRTQRLSFNEARQEAIDAVIGGVKEKLEQPDYRGEIEVALLHYYGETAFDDAVSAPYIELSEKIKEFCVSENSVPVLFSLARSVDEYGKPMSHFTALANVIPGRLTFSSLTYKIPNVKMHAFTEETADVTVKKLSLSGQITTYDSDIFDEEAPANVKYEFELPLSKSEQADDGRGFGMPTTYAYRNDFIDRLADETEPKILIGWPEIEENLINLIKNSKTQLVTALNVKQYFTKAGMSMIEVSEKAPALNSIINSAHLFLKTLEQ